MTLKEVIFKIQIGEFDSKENAVFGKEVQSKPGGETPYIEEEEEVVEDEETAQIKKDTSAAMAKENIEKALYRLSNLEKKL